MWIPSGATNPYPHDPATTESDAAAEAWDVGDAFAGDAFSDDGNSLSPPEGPCPTAPRPVAREARGRSLRRTIALLLPVAVSVLLPGCGAAGGPRLDPPAGPPPSTMALASASTDHGPGPAAPDVASRYHRRDPLQGPND